jgi:hypothetical protein
MWEFALPKFEVSNSKTVLGVLSFQDKIRKRLLPAAFTGGLKHSSPQTDDSMSIIQDYHVSGSYDLTVDISI